MVVGELVTIELVIDAAKRTLNPARRAFVLENGNDQIRRPVPRLAAVEIGQIIVERHYRRDNAFFAECVQGVEIICQPVADGAFRTDTAGDHREVAAMRFVIVTLRAVEHCGENGLSLP